MLIPRFNTGLVAPFLAPAMHRQLLVRLARRELENRYRGSLFGTVWVVIQPLFMLAVFTFVFSVVFASRWKGVGDTRTFALLLYAGLIVYTLFTELVIRAPNLIPEHASYVKKVVFPLEILPWSALLVAMTNALIGLLILVVFQFILVGPPPVTAFLAPLILAPLAILSVGLTFILASLGAFIRDLRQIVPVITQALMFFGPIFYPVEALPEWARPYLFLNPITLPIEALRGALFDGTVPGVELVSYTFVAILVLLVGEALFRRLRPAFADVM